VSSNSRQQIRHPTFSRFENICNDVERGFIRAPIGYFESSRKTRGTLAAHDEPAEPLNRLNGSSKSV
jgi:hypothetical protein